MKFIDIHTHGAFGVDFNKSSKNEIRFLLKELYKKNIKGVCATLVGGSSLELQRQLKIFKEIKIEQLHSIANESLLIGAHLEGSFLNPQKAGIQNKDYFLMPTMENFKSLVGEYEDIVKIVTIAPELNIDLIDYLNNKKIKTQAGHSVGENMNGCIATTHHFCAMNTIHHREKSICLEGLINDNIYCEIIADLIHTNIEALKLFFKIKPRNKVLLVSDSLPSSNFNCDIVFCDKKIINGRNENGVLAGSDNTLDEICNNLIKNNILNYEDINQMAFNNQLDYLDLTKLEIDILNR